MGMIYITGHRNPDVDSICAASAYAALKNMTDPGNEYSAVRCGPLSENVKTILETLGLAAPVYMPDVYPKVRDVMIVVDEKYQKTDLLNTIVRKYEQSKYSAFPVYDGNDFCGIITLDDIAGWMLDELSQKGNVTELPTIGEIMGDQAPPVDAGDRFEDVKRIFTRSPFRGIAVTDENGYAGYVTRRCFLKDPRYDLILVDHNEPKQSINGIDMANILEIIDHHRIDAVKTERPVFIDAEPVGSTCTIIYQMFLHYQKPISPTVAKYLLAGIISDTLILNSPTTTPIDVAAANYLSLLCETTVEKFGASMFSNVLELTNRDAREAVSSDFKTYTQNNVSFGIGQIEVTSLPCLEDYQNQYLEALDEIKRENGLKWALLMITDILHEHSVLLTTESRLTKYLNYTVMSPSAFDMPHVMSRKKQLLPDVLYAIECGF